LPGLKGLAEGLKEINLAGAIFVMLSIKQISFVILFCPTSTRQQIQALQGNIGAAKGFSVHASDLRSSLGML